MKSNGIQFGVSLRLHLVSKFQCSRTHWQAICHVVTSSYMFVCNDVWRSYSNMSDDWDKHGSRRFFHVRLARWVLLAWRSSAQTGQWPPKFLWHLTTTYWYRDTFRDKITISITKVPVSLNLMSLGTRGRRIKVKKIIWTQTEKLWYRRRGRYVGFNFPF